jgi:hypothetical protein
VLLQCCRINGLSMILDTDRSRRINLD